MKKSLQQITKALVLAFTALLPLALSAQAATVLRIGGTGGDLETMRELGRAFEKKYTGIRVMVPPSLGSSGGIKAVLSGALDVAVSSRPLSVNELAKGAVETEYGRTPFVFVTSQKNEIGNLSIRDLGAIYSGQMKTWQDGTLLRLILRPKGDTDNDYLRSLSPGVAKAVDAAQAREGMVTAITDQDNLDAIGEVKGSFGATTLAQVMTEHRPVRIFSIDGVTPSTNALADGTYRFYKCYYAVVGSAPSEAGRSFLSFLSSPEGRAILKKTGHQPEPYRCKSETCERQ